MAEKQLYLHTSNRGENLASRLVEIAQANPLSHALAQETVMTLNPGIARWLQFQIARTTGVSFGWDFPIPGKLFKRVLLGFEPRFETTGAFQEDLARWKLLEILSSLEDQTRFAQIRAYCQSSNGTRRLGFASRLTKLFDEYLVYRPDTIVAWEDDSEASKFEWQAELWRRLIRSLYPQGQRPRHIARLWNELRRGQLLELGLQPENWPERLFVFGVSSLAPLYLDLLDQLSLYRPVHVFLLQPSDLYWADLKTTKQIQKIAKKASRKQGKTTVSPEDWLYETGNPLLPSLGKQSQMFLDLLIDKDALQDDSSFVPPDQSQSQLACLQSDLYTIENRDLALGSEPFPSYDGTIQVHACSSRRREVETIWDLIVSRLDQDLNLRASDILVMAPDIQAYRSHIESVFKAKRGTHLEIPYSIADNSSGQRPGLLSGLNSILAAVSGRASSADILALLEIPLLREVFAFSDQDLEHIEFWIRELGITWGWDAKHRGDHDSFGTDRNTWKELRLRLLSGALFSRPTATPSGYLAYDEIEGELGETAGRLLECLELLRNLRQDFNQTHSLDTWQSRLLALLAKLRCKNEDWQRDYVAMSELILETVPSLPAILATGAEVYRTVCDKLESNSTGGGYLSGGVTFCSLKPMRAIPADTVCLLGMNRLDFPRRSNRMAFDLLAKESRIGDRNTRDEDRQFFLETILSVRSHLLIAYRGISANSDALNEPSAVVEELITYLKNAMSPEDFSEIQKKQRRQSFDPSYFAEDRMHTYDPERAALRNRFSLGSRGTHTAISKNTSTHPEITALNVSDLAAFFRDPSKAFASMVAKLKITTNEDALLEMDPLFSGGLDRYQLRETFAEVIESGRSLSDIDFQKIAQSKTLPAGFLELPSYQAERERAENLASALGKFETRTDYFEAEVNGVNLSGESKVRVTDGRQILIYAGELKPKRVVYAWIHHLFSAAFNPHFSGSSLLLSLHEKGASIQFGKAPSPRETLSTLVELYRDGQRSPLPFFPVLSEIALKAWQNESSEDESTKNYAALEKARREFRNSKGESLFQRNFEWTDYDRICFGDEYVPDQAFLDVSLLIWRGCTESTSKLDLNTVKDGES